MVVGLEMSSLLLVSTVQAKAGIISKLKRNQMVLGGYTCKHTYMYTLAHMHMHTHACKHMHIHALTQFASIMLLCL